MSLLHLSLRRVGNHAHAVPVPPTNAERLAAYRAQVPPPACNHHPWPHLQPKPQPAHNVVRLHRRKKSA